MNENTQEGIVTGIYQEPAAPEIRLPQEDGPEQESLETLPTDELPPVEPELPALPAPIEYITQVF